jgi:hypothetical protein
MSWNDHSKIKDFATVKILVMAITILLIMSLRPTFVQDAFAAEFFLRTNQQVFVPGDVVEIYGNALENEALVIRMYDPIGRAIKLDTITTDEDGFFREAIFEWPQPSKNLAFGTYSVEVISNLKGRSVQTIDVVFAEGTQPATAEPRAAVLHNLLTKLDSPSLVTVNQAFRIFVQVTFDGALVNTDDPASMLGSSHVHSGNVTINLSQNFQKLHEGLYFADVGLEQEGTYIIHSIAFHKGYIAHDSRVITASSSTISSIQESVNELDNRLGTVSEELGHLELRLDETNAALNSTGVEITRSVEEARGSIREEISSAKAAVGELQNASGQVNAIILPVLALISVIIALQISLFARIRSSYR